MKISIGLGICDIIAKGAGASSITTTLDPANKASGIALSNGNLTATSVSGTGGVRSTTGKSGLNTRAYCEFTISSDTAVIGAYYSNVSPSSNYPGQGTSSLGYLAATGEIYLNGAVYTVRPVSTVGDIISLLVVFPGIDPQEPSIGLYKNGVSLYSVLGPEVGIPVFAGIGNKYGAATLGTANFGATPFAYPALASGANWP